MNKIIRKIQSQKNKIIIEATKYIFKEVPMLEDIRIHVANSEFKKMVINIDAYYRIGEDECDPRHFLKTSHLFGNFYIRCFNMEDNFDGAYLRGLHFAIIYKP